MNILFFLAVITSAQATFDAVDTELSKPSWGSWAESTASCDKPVLVVNKSSATLAYKDFKRTYHRFNEDLTFNGGAQSDGSAPLVYFFADNTKVASDPKKGLDLDAADFTMQFNIEAKGKAELAGALTAGDPPPTRVPVPKLKLVLCKAGKAKKK